MSLEDIKVGDYLNQVLGVEELENHLVKVIQVGRCGNIKHKHYPGGGPTLAMASAFEPITLEQIALLAEHPTEEFHL